MRKLLFIVLSIYLLTGCDNSPIVFGIKLGSNFDDLAKKNLVDEVKLEQSKKYVVDAKLKRAPSPDAGSDAEYHVMRHNGKIFGVYAYVDNVHKSTYDALSGYAQQMLGEPIATEDKVMNESAVKETPYKCLIEPDCVKAEYRLYRKGNINAAVVKYDKRIAIQFDTDDAKNLFE
ncbi:hypothetical protein ABLA30_19400 [Xenorhabdus nematophila]|uniref:hypothetical protein n=1 Tax=Xenorhabdus TaxID=626 RepID=UPI0023B31E69|nr:hypothetical protein [Xenorhabdus bovienii]MDE9570615.1 hypothetical protein [Xenorhabdus bovienii]